MKTQSFLLLILSLTVFSHSFSQTAPTIQWQNTIGGSGIDRLYSIQQTNDGGYILGGFSDSPISGDKTESTKGGRDYWIVKTDTTGNLQWQNTIGGNNDDWLYSIHQTTDGGYILGGFSWSGISGDKSENNIGYQDYWIVKTDSAGNIQWENTIGGNGLDELNYIQQTNDGGFILGGKSDSNISGDKTENSDGSTDYWIVKTDTLGTIQWQKTFGGIGRDELICIQQTNDGGYILGGYSDSDISVDKTENCIGGWDYWIVKIDASGNIQWQNTIGGSALDFFQSIHQTSDGGYILGGYSYSPISGDKTENNKHVDYWIIKTDGSGNIQWQNTIGGNGADNLYSIRQTTDGGYILGGLSNSNISGDKTENCIGLPDYWIVKTDSTGNIQWQNTIGGSDDDWPYCILQVADGGYLLGGWSKSDISGDKTENTNGSADYWIIKLAPDTITSTFNVENSILDIKLYPNPANNEITIHLVNSTTYPRGTVSIFDVFGKLVKMELMQSDKLTINNLNDFSKGVYFVEVKTGKEVYRAKFVKE